MLFLYLFSDVLGRPVDDLFIELIPTMITGQDLILPLHCFTFVILFFSRSEYAYCFLIFVSSSIVKSKSGKHLFYLLTFSCPCLYSVYVFACFAFQVVPKIFRVYYLYAQLLHLLFSFVLKFTVIIFTLSSHNLKFQDQIARSTHFKNKSEQAKRVMVIVTEMLHFLTRYIDSLISYCIKFNSF